MVIELFDEVIAVPAKCGTRYFSKCLQSKKSFLPIVKRHEKDDWKKIKWVVVREPIEHLKSAIHTEILPFLNDRNGIESVLNTFISDSGGTHYHPHLYLRLMYTMILLKKQYKPIHISNVSEFIKEYVGVDIPYNKEEYGFNHIVDWKSKDECVDIVKTEFPNHWDKLMKLCESDTIIYNKFINGELMDRILI